MKACSGCKVDFVAVHWYGIYFDDFKKHVTSAYTLTGKKVWVTEFAMQSHDQAQQNDFAAKAIAWLDSTWFVERYSWFGSMRYNQVSLIAALIKLQGGLTALGQKYVS